METPNTPKDIHANRLVMRTSRSPSASFNLADSKVSFSLSHCRRGFTDDPDNSPSQVLVGTCRFKVLSPLFVYQTLS